MSRTGILSDYHVMKHCAIYNPIPMKIADKLLHQDLNVHKQSPFTVKKLKYPNVVPRPNSFNTLANSLTRIAGNDVSVKEHLVKGFLNEIQEMNGNGNGNGSEYSNGTASTASDEGVRLPGDPRAEFESPIQSPESTLSAPSPSLYPGSDYMLSNLPTSPGGTRYTRERLAMERMGFVRQERIHLQEEFERRPRAMSEPYLGDYTGPGPPMTPFVRGTGQILGDNPERNTESLDDRYIVRQSV